jgi:large subunit ribosomal protein L23
MELIRVLKRPVISEKSFTSAEASKYVFLVEKDATKQEVEKAVETAFKVNVIDVNTIIMKGKVKRFGKKIGRRKDYKKAIVTLKKGETIDEFKGF